MIVEESMSATDSRELALGAEGRAVLQGEAARLSRYLGCGLDEEDLLQAGRIGLLLAAERYDPRRGRFGSYARWWVLAEMAKVIHQSRSPVPIPATVRCQLRRCRALTGQAVPGGLAAVLGVSERQAQVLQTLLQDGVEEADCAQLADPNAADEDVLVEALEQARRVGVLREALAQLPERERQVLTGLYGLEGASRQTLRQVGEQVGLSHQRVQQLRRLALGRLRKRLRSDESRPCRAVS